MRAPAAPLGRGVLYNLAGVGAPAVMALVAIPLLAGALGSDRFGILGLLWSAMGYLALLNLGVGRAVVHATASGEGREDLPELVWTAALLLTAVGLASGAALFAAAPALASGLLRLQGPLAAETVTAVRVLALAAPFTVSGSAFSAVLEARQRFGAVNLVVVPLSAVSFFGPLLALRAGEGLVPVVAVLLAGRAGAWAAYLVLCLREVPRMRAGPAFASRHLRPLLGFGGWVTVSQVVSPLMVYADRFVVGGLLSAGAVAYYVVPQEAMLRLGGLSGAVAAVLFPAFAAAAPGARLARLMERGMAAVLLGVFPAALAAYAFGGELLELWVGAEYAARGATVLRWLSVGLLVNALAKVPSSLLVGRGRPQLTALLHLAQLPFYAAALWLLVAGYGIAGAAAAWLLRVSVDCAALYWLAGRLLPPGPSPLPRAAGIAGAGAACMVAVGAVPHAGARAAALGVVLAAFLAVAWFGLLDPAGRGAVRAAFAGRRRP